MELVQHHRLAFVLLVDFNPQQIPPLLDTIDYAQIMSLGDFIDFGDLTDGRWGLTGGLSNGHGGL